jgi:A/G-specific adenine glycosylase
VKFQGHRRTRAKLKDNVADEDVCAAGIQPRFSSRLLAWYDAHARDLPWREGRDPYRVWLSEIMLQQTRVAAVLEHYRGFLRRFPTVQKLAAAREASVLGLWSGLGYYRRARMLHAAAKLVVREHGGRFPETSQTWRQLPGIGRYTAAAIASIAFAEPVAVVDGNVERVLSRLLGKPLDERATWRAAEELLDRKRPGDANQAMMELGATVCLPREPKCLLCPVSEFCVTRGDLPRTSKPAPQTKREIHFGLARRNGEVFLRQRSKTESVMPGMWELPHLSGEQRGRALLSLRHSITVTDYSVRVLELACPDEHAGNWIAGSRLTSLPLTGLARKILRKVEML